MKISKTLMQAIVVAVTVGSAAACTKSVDSKPQQNNIKNPKTDSTVVYTGSCPACGMG